MKKIKRKNGRNSVENQRFPAVRFGMIPTGLEPATSTL
ncbi:hypothetical protein CHCC20333_2353 [Bacillus paralicheniformis]|nr:hypothetical protein CHCC20333_2353 [Bacillus paralicheniformis]